MNVPAPRSTSLELPVVGTAVTYHGSITEHHRRFLLFPHYSIYSTGEHDEDVCAELGERSTLLECNKHLVLNHVRPTSFTMDSGIWWPEDAIDLVSGSHIFKLSHTLPGGSPQARVIVFYAADGRLLQDYMLWATDRIESDTLRRLDQRGLTRRPQKAFSLPAQSAR
ncbi:hypothetical protein ABZ069_37625 [Streptomyces microflavus]|uniref:hypothetical protein n=1 Tax=Streptomyces microflavus TaxID=1919 RepID=UPI0033A7076B